MASIDPFWLTVFVDLPAGHHADGQRFWSAVTGWPVSPPRGEDGEFTTLLPAGGEPHVKLQRVGGTTPRTHLDLHVADPTAASATVEDLGGVVVQRSPHGYVVMRSPGGYVFCLVGHEQRDRPAAPTEWPGGHTSLLDQVCLDIPGDDYDAELAFWAPLTGWAVVPSATRPELTRLRHPEGQAVHVLLQRLEHGDGPVRGHLDLATTDRAAEVARHELLGATREPTQPGERWTVLRAPTGERYCITDRDPLTGRLP